MGFGQSGVRGGRAAKQPELKIRRTFEELVKAMLRPKNGVIWVNGEERTIRRPAGSTGA